MAGGGGERAAQGGRVAPGVGFACDANGFEEKDRGGAQWRRGGVQRGRPSMSSGGQGRACGRGVAAWGGGVVTVGQRLPRSTCRRRMGWMATRSTSTEGGVLYKVKLHAALALPFSVCTRLCIRCELPLTVLPIFGEGSCELDVWVQRGEWLSWLDPRLEGRHQHSFELVGSRAVAWLDGMACRHFTQHLACVLALPG